MRRLENQKRYGAIEPASTASSVDQQHFPFVVLAFAAGGATR